MRGSLRLTAAAAIALMGLPAACGEDEPERSSRSTSEAAEETTTTAQATTTTEDENVGAEWGALFAANDRGALDLTVPGSPAYLYTEGTQLLAESTTPAPDPETATVNGDSVSIAGVVFGDFVVQDGKIADLSRNEKPISGSVAPGDGTVYEAGGISGRIHSIRYFDGNLQFLITTTNSGPSKGWVQVTEYAAEGKQYANVFGNELLPVVTSTYMDAFEEAPAGGVGYGIVWVDGTGQKEFQVQVPPLT